MILLLYYLTHPSSHGIDQKDIHQGRFPARYVHSTNAISKITLNKTQLTFLIALFYLDEEIGKSKSLRKAVPLKLVAVGGFVAVSYFHNRASTEDLDYMIDPGLNSMTKIEGKLACAIKAVAYRKGYDEGWVNDNVRMFAVGDSAQPLFQESVEQNVVLWRGKNLVIYAVKWEWSLARKVKRIGSTGRDADVSDAVALLRQMVDDSKGPI